MTNQNIFKSTGDRILKQIEYSFIEMYGISMKVEMCVWCLLDLKGRQSLEYISIDLCLNPFVALKFNFVYFHQKITR